MPLQGVPGLTRISQVFSPTDTALIVAALDAVGIKVFVPGFHMLSNYQHYAVALGGVPVMVETARAREAMDFLDALEALDVETLDPDAPDMSMDDLPARKSRGMLHRIAVGAFYFLTGTAPPVSGWFHATEKS